MAGEIAAVRGQFGDRVGPLAQVVEHQAREDHEQPRRPDRPFAEVAHVGIERLGPCDGQEGRAQDEEAGDPVRGQELHPRPGAQRPEDPRLAEQVHDPQRGDRHEPDQADRTEQVGDLGGAPRLADEQADQDHQAGDQHHRVGHVRPDVRDALQALHRRQHGDRGREHGVAVEQGRAEDAEEEDPSGSPAQRMLRQGHQRQDAAFALVVGPHDHGGVLHRHHHHQGPQHQRDDPDDGLRAEAARRGCAQPLSEGVEGARADVAEHHAHGPEGQAQEASMPAGRVRRVMSRPSVGGIGQSVVARHGPEMLQTAGRGHERHRPAPLNLFP